MTGSAIETSARFGDREKAALAYAEAITWRLEAGDELWERLHRHFSEPELVELGCFIALTMGQQSWLRLLWHLASALRRNSPPRHLIKGHFMCLSRSWRCRWRS